MQVLSSLIRTWSVDDPKLICYHVELMSSMLFVLQAEEVVKEVLKAIQRAKADAQKEELESQKRLVTVR